MSCQWPSSRHHAVTGQRRDQLRPCCPAPFTTTTIPGVATPVRVINGAFSNFHEVDEYSIALNYYFKRQLLKWQTDLSYYKGGNPAGGGTSPAGFIAGSDGWLLRTQIQLAF